MANSNIKPSARRDDILVSELEDEVLLYDTKHKKAHALNTTAALVWKQCDGDTTLTDIAAQLEARGVTPGEHAVAIALQQLSQAGLMRPEPSMPAEGLSRREFGRRAGQLGLAAGLAPLVASVVAPTAMAATSAAALCGVNKICSTDSDCGIPANLCHCTTSRDNPAVNVCTPK